MKKTEFRTPLLQSAAVLGGVIFLAIIAASSGSSTEGGGFFAILAGIGNTILFIIGLAVGLSLSIALLVGIFLAAVAMVSPEQASQMYSDLKKNFSLSLLTCKDTWSCCANNGPGVWFSEEEYDRMKQEIIDLQDNKGSLIRKIDELQADNALFRGNFNDLSGENAHHRNKIEELRLVVENLQNSENEIKNLLSDLTGRMPISDDREIVKQIDKLEVLQTESKREIDHLNDRLATIELALKQTSTSGIFSYIDKDEDQALFIKMVEDAIAQDLTYAQIDEYLSTRLPVELDKIIKDHPSLTRNYIKNLRQ